VESVAVFEKDISYGYAGALATDIKGALYDALLRPKFSSFVAGLGGRDVAPETLASTATAAITGMSKVAWMDVRC
jgi:pyruvate/2-oxoacid:ferredoxin oxidoreductase alpha subunit